MSNYESYYDEEGYIKANFTKEDLMEIIKEVEKKLDGVIKEHRKRLRTQKKHHDKELKRHWEWLNKFKEEYIHYDNLIPHTTINDMVREMLKEFEESHE